MHSRQGGGMLLVVVVLRVALAQHDDTCERGPTSLATSARLPFRSCSCGAPAWHVWRAFETRRALVAASSSDVQITTRASVDSSAVAALARLAALAWPASFKLPVLLGSLGDDEHPADDGTTQSTSATFTAAACRPLTESLPSTEDDDHREWCEVLRAFSPYGESCVELSVANAKSSSSPSRTTGREYAIRWDAPPNDGARSRRTAVFLAGVVTYRSAEWLAEATSLHYAVGVAAGVSACLLVVAVLALQLVGATGLLGRRHASTLRVAFVVAASFGYVRLLSRLVVRGLRQLLEDWPKLIACYVCLSASASVAGTRYVLRTGLVPDFVRAASKLCGLLLVSFWSTRSAGAALAFVVALVAADCADDVVALWRGLLWTSRELVNRVTRGLSVVVGVGGVAAVVVAGWSITFGRRPGWSYGLASAVEAVVKDGLRPTIAFVARASHSAAVGIPALLNRAAALLVRALTSSWVPATGGDVGLVAKATSALTQLHTGAPPTGVAAAAGFVVVVLCAGIIASRRCWRGELRFRDTRDPLDDDDAPRPPSYLQDGFITEREYQAQAAEYTAAALADLARSPEYAQWLADNHQRAVLSPARSSGAAVTPGGALPQDDDDVVAPSSSRRPRPSSASKASSSNADLLQRVRARRRSSGATPRTPASYASSPYGAAEDVDDY